MVNSFDILNAGVVVVDDQDTSVLPLERMLRGAGHVCFWASIITFPLMAAVQEM